MQEKIKILKVKINTINLKQATDIALNMANDKNQHFIATPNPEILLEAKKNTKFRKILNRSDLNTPDGAGILWAAHFLNSVNNTNSFYIKFLKWIGSLASIPFRKNSILKERVTGADLVNEICKKSINGSNKIFLLGAQEGIAEKTAKTLKNKYKNLNIVGTYAGTPAINEEGKITKKINSSKANVLFVAYGAPKQELWIYRNLKKMPHVKLAAGIGGTFDFIAGKVKRAPVWMQKAGLEWVFRLIQQPKRIKRIINASIIFPIKILFNS